MEEAVRARDAAREAVRNITPDPLRNVIYELLVETSMAPGALTVLSARSVDRATNPSNLDTRAAGVQLIYEGLRLTRTLARENPWDGQEEETADSNLDILAADVMVSRGYFLLARTEAAEKAVATVRAFGREQMSYHQSGGHPDAQPRGLEASVFQLAVIAGTTATGVEPSAALKEFAADLTSSLDDGQIPDAPDILTESVRNSLSRLSTQGKTRVGDEQLWSPSASDS